MRCTWDAQQRVQENNKQRNAAQQATDSQTKPEKLQKLAKKNAKNTTRCVCCPSAAIGVADGQLVAPRCPGVVALLLKLGQIAEDLRIFQASDNRTYLF